LQFIPFFYTLYFYKLIMMNQYEITYISSANLDEAGRTRLDGTIDSKVAELGGSTSHTTASLRRRLAYQIKKQTSGFLRYIHFEIEPEHIDTIKQILRKEGNILRFSILATHKRQEAAADVIAKYVQKKGDNAKKKMGGKNQPYIKSKPAAPVTDEAVAKGIEEALSEEVK